MRWRGVDGKSRPIGKRRARIVRQLFHMSHHLCPFSVGPREAVSTPGGSRLSLIETMSAKTTDNGTRGNLLSTRRTILAFPVFRRLCGELASELRLLASFLGSRQYCANEQSKWPHDNAHDHTKPRGITFAGRDPATQESEYDIKENSNDQKHLIRLTERTALAALRGTRQTVDEGQCTRCISRAPISRQFGRDDLHPTEVRGSDATQFSIW